jgi:cell division septal protein FtsQ
MRRWLLLLAAGVLGTVTLVLAARTLLRHVSFFRVRQIELVGVRYHSPDQVLAGLGLEPDQNLFTPASAIERRAAGIPGVIDLEVRRKLPGTLEIAVHEQQPVAFLATDSGLLVLDIDANPMGYDPAKTGLDLPFVEQPDSGLLRALALVQAADSALYDRVEAARLGPGGAILLELGSKKIMLGAEPSATDVRTILAVRQSLADSGQTFDQLDARFNGQVVVRRGGD